MMSFDDIKKAIHKKYPDKYTDEEIENFPIVIGNDYESMSTDVQINMVSIINDGSYMRYDYGRPILTIEAF